MARPVLPTATVLGRPLLPASMPRTLPQLPGCQTSPPVQRHQPIDYVVAARWMVLGKEFGNDSLKAWVLKARSASTNSPRFYAMSKIMKTNATNLEKLRVPIENLEDEEVNKLCIVEGLNSVRTRKAKVEALIDNWAKAGEPQRQPPVPARSLKRQLADRGYALVGETSDTSCSGHLLVAGACTVNKWQVV